MERIVALVVMAANCWALSPSKTRQVTAMGSYYTHTSGNGSEPDVTHASWEDLDLGTCGCRRPDACDRHVHVTLAVLQSAADCPSGMRYCCSAQEIDRTLTANKPREGYNGTERMLLERDAQENKLVIDSRNKVNNKTKWMEANTKYRNREKDYAGGGSVHEGHVQLVTPKDLSSPKRQNRETHDTVHATSAMENVYKEMPNVSPDLVGSNDTHKNLKDDNYTLVTKYKLATTESSAQPFITTDSGSLITATEGSTAAVKHTNESEEASIKTKEKSPASWPLPGPMSVFLLDASDIVGQVDMK
nr:uncharacterized protein LOC123759833 [Procambarus clarkii]